MPETDRRFDLSRVTNEHGKLEAYAWPGGYDIAYYTEDGGTLCPFCANDNRDVDDPQWNVIAFDVTDSWEDSEACDHCARPIGNLD